MTTRQYHRADTVGVYPVCKGCPALKEYRQQKARVKKYQNAHADDLKKYDAGYQKSHAEGLAKYRAERRQDRKNRIV